MTQAIIFDVDGTLLHSSAEDEALYKQAVEQVLGPVSFRAALDDYEHVTDSGILLQVFDDNAIQPDDALFDDIKAMFFQLVDAYIRQTGPFRETPGARQLLQALQDSASHSVAIATGGWRQSAMAKLAAAGFDISGIPLASGDDAIARADIMRKALDSIALVPDSVTYFGDEHWDQQACERLGWSFRAVGPVLNGLSSFESVLQELAI